MAAARTITLELSATGRDGHRRGPDHGPLARPAHGPGRAEAEHHSHDADPELPNDFGRTPMQLVPNAHAVCEDYEHEMAQDLIRRCTATR